MINLLKFLVKCLSPFVLAFIFTGLIQGFSFNMQNWSNGFVAIYISLSVVLFFSMLGYILNEE